MPSEPTLYRLGASVYAMRQGQILLLHRADGPMTGFWGTPGGGVDEGEAIKDAAVRELAEETGLTPTGPLQLVTAVPLKAGSRHFLRLMYVADCATGDVVLSHEHAGFQWLSPQDYAVAYLNDAEVERWRQVSEEDAFNIHSCRQAVYDLLAFLDNDIPTGGREVNTEVISPQGAGCLGY